MDDLLQVAFYVLAVILYAVFKARKPKPENMPPYAKPAAGPPAHRQSREVQHPAPRTQAETARPHTIEEMLREFGKSYETPAPVKEVTYTEPQSPYSAANIERLSASQEKEAEIEDYETSGYQGGLAFEYPELETAKPNPYALALKDPHELRKAFILSEILRRKYN